MPTDCDSLHGFLNRWTSADKKQAVIEELRAQAHNNIDYVPTQIMTEYFRHIYRTKKGSPIMGVKYPSAYTGKPCYVMFWGHREDEDVNPEIIGNWSQDPTVQKLESVPDESCVRSATRISYSFKTVQTEGEQARWYNELEPSRRRAGLDECRAAKRQTLLQTQSATATRFAAAIAHQGVAA